MEKDYFVHESSYVDEDVEIGEGTRIWHFCHIQKGARIGRRCSLGQNVNISNHVKIGDGCKLQNNVSLYEGVELEDYVFCGPSCVFTNDLTPRSKYPKGSAGYKKTLIREGASIGANATIVCGHTVGRWALIGAGAVVADNVPDHALMLGVPARLVGYVCACGARMKFENGRAVCAACGRTYLKSPDGNVEEA
ncbi:acyltransferase [Pseudoflavonifractor phocaeensis]|uniref:acyltransferase n=1 Tax=Pseudoflavonifractor phocaeensis TaxID=1870988 RepID=UPI001F44F0C5|nr:acyltransferase [Pseudoflavonifractor phocaeensis]MCF2595526.1 N-acetyltransferase [Pseudoflavonifractor phocaeensis]